MIIYTVEIEWSSDFISSTQITRVIHVYIYGLSRMEKIFYFMESSCQVNMIIATVEFDRTKDFNSNNIKVKHDHSHC